MRQIGIDGIIFGLQPVGGISTYFLELLSRLARDAPDQTVLGLPKDVVSNANDQLQRLPLQRMRERLPVLLARYARSPTLGRIVHTSYYRRPVRRATLSVVTVYDFAYERFRTGVPRTVHSWQKRAACRRADAIACISANTRADLLAHYPEIDPAIVFVTPLAADHDRFFISSEARLGFERKVLFIGQRGGYKRFDLAVDAVAATGLSLAVIGPPIDASERHMLDSRLNGRWIALGRVRDDELRSIYGGAFALLYPSDYEGFGLPILEAQACGCPVITARRSSLPEVGGQAAIYAEEQRAEDYATGLLHLEDSTSRVALIERGVANAAAFQWDRTYRLTREIYDRLLAR